MNKRNASSWIVRLLCFTLVFASVIPMFPNLQTARAAEGAGSWVEVPLTNGSFEDARTENNVGINGWRYHPSLTRAGIELSAEQANEGSQSVKLTGVGGTGVETDAFSVTPGEKYTVTYDVYVDSVQGAPSVWFRWFSDANGATQASIASNPLSTDLPLHAWTEVTAEVTVPANAASARILIYVPSTAKMVGYFDDFRLKKYVEAVEPEPEVPDEPETSLWKPLDVVNAGFEAAPVDGTLSISGWKYLETGYSDGAELRTDDKYEGSQSAYFSGVKNMGLETEPFPIVSGKEYKATIQAKLSALSGQVRLWLRWYRADGAHLTDNYLTVSTVEFDKWNELTIMAAAPADAAYASVLVYASSASSITGYFDDLKVYENMPADVGEEEPNRLNVINGSFEDSAVGAMASGWTFWSSGNRTGVEVSKDRAAQGGQSLKLTNVTATGLQSTLISVAGGQKYKASLQMYPTAPAGDRGPGLWIRWYTANNTLINADVVVYKNDVVLNEWNSIVAEGRAPSEAAYAMIFVYASGGTQLTGYIDDVRMYNVVDPSELVLEHAYGSPINLGDATIASKTSGAVIANEEIYFATNGSPSVFYAISAVTGEVLAAERLSGSVNVVWAIAAGSDNNIYFGGTTNGNLYRYDPAQKKVTTLGSNPAGEFIWDLDASADGKIYGGTYPTGDMFAYDIANGAFENLGVLREDQQYVRGTGVSGDFVYGGTGSFAYLYKINRRDGTKTEIPMPITGEATMVSNVWKYNDLLFVAYGTSLIVMNEETGEVVRHMNWQEPVTFDGALSQPSPLSPNLLYFRNKNTSALSTYDTATNTVSAVEPEVILPQDSLKVMTWTTLSGGEHAGKPVLLMVTASGRYTLYDPTSHTLTEYSTQVEAQGVYMNSLETGPDGKLYIGGYMGSYSIYDPATGTYVARETKMNQSEGIGFYNGKVYFGTYGSAVIYRYDPNEPLSFGSTPEYNPGLIHDIADDQDRPFVFETGGDKLFIGTFPVYGVLGGAVTVYDETAGTWDTYRNIVRNQSIFGLAYHDGLLYGGTSVSGGLGVDPSENEAKLFVWNPDSATKMQEFVPQVPGIATPKLIGDLTFDEQGWLWGGIAGLDAEGKVDMGIFAYNPVTNKIEKSKILVENAEELGSMYRPYYLRWENGLLYTTIGRQLIVVDPETLRHVKLLDQTVNLMTVGQDGAIYYAYGSQMFKLPVALDHVSLSVAEPQLAAGEQTSISVQGKLINGRDAYVYAGTVSYSSSDSSIVRAEDGELKAVSPGTADVWATVTLDGVTKVTARTMVQVTEAVVSLEDPGDTEEPGETEEPGVEEPGHEDTVVPGGTNSSGNSGAPGSSGEEDAVGTDSLPIEEIVEVERNGRIEKMFIVSGGQLPATEAGQDFVVRAPATEGGAIVRMTGSLIQQLAEGAFGVMIQAGQASITLPATVVNDLLNAIAAEGSDLRIDIRIAPTSEDVRLQSAQAAEAKGYSLLQEPVEFEITASNGRQSEEITRFTSYVERQIQVSDEETARSIATAVVIEPDGNFRAVPTKVKLVDGKYMVIIKSLTNSVYALISNDMSFRDTEVHWARGFIESLAERAVLTGRTTDAFAPDEHITRAEFAAALVRGLGLKVQTEGGVFQDVADRDWFHSFVMTASANGLISGYDDGTFRPNEAISREESMVIIARAMRLTALEASDALVGLASFDDSSLIASWASEGVAVSLNAGIVAGRTERELAPKQSITRAEVAVIINRLLTKSDLIE